MSYLPVGITNKDHFLQELAIRCGLWNNFPENEKQFLDSVVLQWQHKPDDDHQNTWDLVSGEDYANDLFQCLNFLFCVPFLCGIEVMRS